MRLAPTEHGAFVSYYQCLSCEREFDPVATRWLCPHCHFKASCCEGEPQ